MRRSELCRFHMGDRALLRDLVQAESPRLLHYANALCGDRDQAADLVQETWIKAYRQRNTFRGDSPLLSWLVSICRSLYLSARRTADRRDELLTATVPIIGHEPNRSSAEATDCLARKRLAAALGGLSDRQRDVVVLRVVEGLSTRECAERLGIPEGTVKSSLSRGLDSLRTLLEDLKP